MKVVIAIDSFKGSLSSIAAGEAAAAGIRDAIPEAEALFVLADGTVRTSAGFPAA